MSSTYPNFDNTSLNSNSNDLEFYDDINLSFNFESQQRQTTNDDRNNGTYNHPIVSSANLTTQASHNYYGNMLPTPEGSEFNNIIPSSEHLSLEDTYKDSEEYFLGSPESVSIYIPSLISPQTSPTLLPDASMSITSPTNRQNKRPRVNTFIPKNKSSNNSISQSRNKLCNKDNGNNNNNHSPNGQYNANTSIMTGSPNHLTSNQIAIFSLLELTSPLMNTNMAATSIAPSLQEVMPNLNLGSNLVSDGTDTSTNISEPSSDRIIPLTPSTLMKFTNEESNSPKSGQNESSSNSQQQTIRDQFRQLQHTSKDNSAFIAPKPPTRIVTTGAASQSGTLGKKPVRSSTNTSSPLTGPSKSPHSLKPTISPNLKPKLPGVLADEVAEQLANKSNYRSILEGTARSLGISYSSDVQSSLEFRRTTHKAAEQKRRDSLKQSFDELKKVLPCQPMSSKNSDDNNGKNNNSGKSDGNMKNVSKLFLLKRARDYIMELEQKSKEKDGHIQKLNDELDELKGVKRQKIEDTEKKEDADKEIDIEMKAKSSDEQQTTSSDEF